jgi:hypothetical protein
MKNLKKVRKSDYEHESHAHKDAYYLPQPINL